MAPVLKHLSGTAFVSVAMPNPSPGRRPNSCDRGCYSVRRYVDPGIHKQGELQTGLTTMTSGLQRESLTTFCIRPSAGLRESGHCLEP
jgi:hypothetical protein